jgi:hypothetical protein
MIMVPSELINTLRADFQDFLNNFKSELYNENPIVVKTISHIGKVVENVRILAVSLELNENEKIVAELIAKYHDIGRLWALLPENMEKKIADHAEAGVEYLKTNMVFNQLDEPTQHIIIQVIKNHNKPDLPRKEGEAVLFYAMLVRDADKLETWRTTVENITRKNGRPNLAAELAISNKPFVTPSFIKIIMEGNIPNKNDIVTLNDFIIFQMSWIFELHLKKSFQILNQKQFIRQLYDVLPKNDPVIEVYRAIRIYIENKI